MPRQRPLVSPQIPVTVDTAEAEHERCGTGNVDRLRGRIGGLLGQPVITGARGDSWKWNLQLPLMAGRIAHLRTSPTSPGAAGCPALTGRRLPDLRAARRTRDPVGSTPGYGARWTWHVPAIDLACTWLAIQALPPPRAETMAPAHHPGAFPGLRQQRSLYLRLFGRCHAVYSHR
jgi:hypothetical protein